MSEIADLYSKITAAQKALKSTREVPDRNKDDIKKLLEVLEKTLKELTRQRDDLLSCIKELDSLDSDIDAYNKKQNRMSNHAGSLKKLVGSINIKSKLLTELKDAAARLDSLPALDRSSR